MSRGSSSRELICQTIETYDKEWINDKLKESNRNAVSDSILVNAKYVGIPAALEIAKVAIVKASKSVAAKAIASKLPYIGWAITAAGVGDAISSAIQTQRLQDLFDQMEEKGGYVKVVTNTYEQGSQSKRYNVTCSYVYYMIGQTPEITMSGDTVTLA